MNGFNRFKSLIGIHYVESGTKEVNTSPEVETPADRVMNLIFARDKHGWPNSSVEVMLSPKTSDEVRNFIQQNLLVAKDEQHLFNQPEIVHEFQNLSSEFIAKVSRNRYESVEEYEKRLNDIIDDYNKQETFKSFHERLRKFDEQLK